MESIKSIPIRPEQSIKARLIAKVMENTNDLDIQEQMELFRLDLYEVVAQAVEERLNSMSEDQLLEFI